MRTVDGNQSIFMLVALAYHKLFTDIHVDLERNDWNMMHLLRRTFIYNITIELL